MGRRMLIELDAPDDLGRFDLPPGVHQRLQRLLDKQDREGALSGEEREEAEGLVDLTELLSFLKARSQRP